MRRLALLLLVACSPAPKPVKPVTVPTTVIPAATSPDAGAPMVRTATGCARGGIYEVTLSVTDRQGDCDQFGDPLEVDWFIDDRGLKVSRGFLADRGLHAEDAVFGGDDCARTFEIGTAGNAKSNEVESLRLALAITPGAKSDAIVAAGSYDWRWTSESLECHLTLRGTGRHMSPD